MSDTLVANELLAFVQQKLDVMDEVSVIQICASNFSEEEIAAAKQLVFRLLNKSDQMVSRRCDGTRKSLQGVITLLNETEPDEVPTFVARDLHKLPPVTFDHVDVTSLLKDIVSLKASLAELQMKLSASEVTVADLRIELEALRKSVPITGSPTRVNNVNTRRDACLNTSATSYASAVLSPTLTAEPALCAASASRSPAPAPAAPPHCAARIVRTADPTVTASTPAKPLPAKATNRSTKDGFVTVQRRKCRSRNIKNGCGKAPVDPNLKVHATSPNTPVYISRLYYTTEAEDIAKYVCRKLKYVPRVQLLESRRNVNFKAFVVGLPDCYLHKVLDESFWPQDVIFRRLRGQVPAECTNAERNYRGIAKYCVILLLLAFILFLPLGVPDDSGFISGGLHYIAMYFLCILCKTAIRIILILETIVNFIEDLFQHFLDFLDDLNLCVRFGVKRTKVSEDLIEAIERPDDSCKLNTEVYVPSTVNTKNK